MPLVGPFTTRQAAIGRCLSSSSSSVTRRCPCAAGFTSGVPWPVTFVGCDCQDTALTAVGGGTYLDGFTYCNQFRRDLIFISVFCQTDVNGEQSWTAVLNGPLIPSGHVNVTLTPLGCTLSGTFATTCGFVTMVVTIPPSECTPYTAC